ncbi:carboxyl transferase domain-containing protein [Sorangium sp. So ce375]|uniref:carboxyl transferase domain-containing protein n=1 Tax=Sorangium sp. So ce375 TaxID=3133306 RepID=UPI003F5B6F83
MVAGQPRCPPAASTSRRTRFVRFWDCFTIPLVTSVDVPGLLPGARSGTWRDHRSWSEAPLCARRGDGARERPQNLRGAYDVMASKHLRADYNLAFPTAEIAVMAPEGAVGIVHRGRSSARPSRPTPAHASSRITRRNSPTPTRRPSSASSTR